MSKYYKAEDVIRAIAEQLCWIARTEYGDKFTTEDWLEEAEDYVSDLPTIDIVRCEDCKWYKDFDGCFFSTAECEPEHFCSWGERIEE